MIGWLLGRLLFVLLGFLFGYWTSRLALTLGVKILLGIVLWLPIVALLLLQSAEVIAPDTLSSLLLVVPGVIKLLAVGFLVGYTLKTILDAARLSTG